jgi:uncharacterized protein YecE (DUF72 family)
MEFGRVSLAELDKIALTLPTEPGRNAKVLPGKPAKGKVFVGMTQWGREEWVGKIYPVKVKTGDFLSHYVKHFNTVELNATHYRIHSKNVIQKWKATADQKDFKFCPKVFKDITHQGALNDKGALLNEFLQSIQNFEDHLGPIFIQLSESFNRKKELFEFLESLPTNLQFFLEIRHPDLLANEALFDYLQQKNIGIVITDTAGRRDCAHMKLTVPKTFIRFISNEGHPSDYTRIWEWAERVKFWLDQGIEEVYFFVHMNDEIQSLDLANYVIKSFNKICETKIPELEFIK